MRWRDIASHAAYAAEFANRDANEDEQDIRYGYRFTSGWDSYALSQMWRARRTIPRDGLPEGVRGAVNLVRIGCHVQPMNPCSWETCLVLELYERKEDHRGALGATPLHDPRDSALEMDPGGDGETPTKATSGLVAQHAYPGVVSPTDGQATLNLADGPQPSFPRWWRFEVRTMHAGYSLGLVLRHELNQVRSPVGDNWHEGDPDAYREEFTQRQTRFEPKDYLEIRLWWSFGNVNFPVQLPLEGIVEAMQAL